MLRNLKELLIVIFSLFVLSCRDDKKYILSLSIKWEKEFSCNLTRFSGDRLTEKNRFILDERARNRDNSEYCFTILSHRDSIIKYFGRGCDAKKFDITKYMLLNMNLEVIDIHKSDQIMDKKHTYIAYPCGQWGYASYLYLIFDDKNLFQNIYIAKDR